MQNKSTRLSNFSIISMITQHIFVFYPRKNPQKCIFSYYFVFLFLLLWEVVLDHFFKMCAV